MPIRADRSTGLETSTRHTIWPHLVQEYGMPPFEDPSGERVDCKFHIKPSKGPAIPWGALGPALPIGEGKRCPTVLHASPPVPGAGWGSKYTNGIQVCPKGGYKDKEGYEGQ